MSEENKSAIVDNTESSNEDFNPIAFGDTFMPEKDTATETVEETKEESVEATTEESDDWTFDEPSEPTITEEVKSGDDAARDEVNWGAIANQLGLEGKSTKEEIQEALKAVQEKKEEEQKDAPSNEFDQMNSLLKLDDKGLMVEELKARGFADAEVEDYIDRLEDAGTLKYEALKVRNDIRKHVVDSETKAKEEAKAAEEQKAKQI